MNTIWYPEYGALLATGRIHDQFDWWIYFYKLVCWKNLQNRYSALWEKSYLERNDKMDIQKKLTFNV